MPRSVSHDVHGGELRVWRTSDLQLHVKLAAAREHQGQALEVESRWDIPPEASEWWQIAGAARDGDAEAAQDLSDTMFAEAVEAR